MGGPEGIGGGVSTVAHSGDEREVCPPNWGRRRTPALASLGDVSRSVPSVSAVARVQRLDGGSRVVAVSHGPEDGWKRLPRGLRLTHEALDVLRADGVRTVRLRRGLRVAHVPLTWFPVAGLSLV